METLKDIFINNNQPVVKCADYYNDRKFQSYPEVVTDQLQKVVYGIHVAHEDFTQKPISIHGWVCVYGEAKLREMGFFQDPWSVIDRLKKSHGEYVYIVKMYFNQYCGVVEVEDGDEYRQLGGLVDMKPLNI